MKRNFFTLFTAFLCLSFLLAITGCSSMQNPGQEFADATATPYGFYPQGGPSSKRAERTGYASIKPTNKKTERIVYCREIDYITEGEGEAAVTTENVSIFSGVAVGDPTTAGQTVKTGTEETGIEYRLVAAKDIVGEEIRILDPGTIEVKGGEIEVWSASLLEPLTVQKNPGLLSTIATGLFDFAKDAVLFKYLSGGSDSVTRILPGAGEE